MPLFLAVSLTSCSDNGSTNDNGDDPGTETDHEYKQHMCSFVQSISSYAKGISPGFIIIPQNGHELLTVNGEEDGQPDQTYITAIDGVGREDLFYGYSDDNKATPTSDREYMISFMDIAEDQGIQVLVTDYCSTHSFMDDSYKQNAQKGYISFAANHRELDNIPSYPSAPYNINDSDVTSLNEAKNFIYLLNPGGYATKEAFLKAIRDTDYDLVIIDMFYEGTDELTASDVESLKTKKNGGRRSVIAYMSIGEAEDYRYYWKDEWKDTPPSWLAEENPAWKGNYKVRYWDEQWQNIIYGDDVSYIKKVLDAGFNGVYLDIIDAFEYFE